MNKTTIIILCIFLLLIIFGVILVLIIKNRKRKNITNNIDRLIVEKNSIISSILTTELNKATKLANNKKILKDIEKWKNIYKEIECVDLDRITDKIVEIDNYLTAKNIKKCKELIVETEKDILHVKVKSSELLNEIKNLTESEQRNREAITKLKSSYREIIFKYNKNKNDYKDVASRIDLQMENIDKLFSGFEVAIANNEFEQISTIVKALDDIIHNIEVVIDEAPTIVLMGTIMLPKKMNDISNMAAKMKREGYNLEYINLEYNIEQTNKKINEIMDRLNVLNLENSIFDLKTLLDYYEGIYNDFDNERTSKRNYERALISITDRINKTSNVIRNLYSEIDNLKDTYDLKEEDIIEIDNINKELIKVKDSFKLINDRTLIRMFPYSKLCYECELVLVSLSNVEDKLELTLRNLGNLKEDELRARDQLIEIKTIIKDSRHKIKEYNLPIIPKKFYVELKEANDAVDEICKELERRPISIKTLNLRVDTARDLSLKLYQTTSSIIKQASMVEFTIMYGNRYRSSSKEVEKGLITTTKLFSKGNYSEALEVILNTLNIVEPGIHKRILKEDFK